VNGDRATARLLWTGLFGVAFGWVEAAVVVYLRRIYYPEGFAFPLRMIDPGLLSVELAREAATLVMLLAVALLAGRGRWGRFGYFLVAFGIWDLVYYAGLAIVLGWPARWSDWDILFLLPIPWVAPVYAPVAIAIGMVVAGGAIARLEAARVRMRADGWTWAAGVAGAATTLYSFMHDIDAGLGRSVPRDYPVGLWLIGLVLFGVAFWRFLSRSQGGAAR